MRESGQQQADAYLNKAARVRENHEKIQRTTLTKGRHEGAVDGTTTDTQINNYADTTSYHAAAVHMTSNPPTQAAFNFLDGQIEKAQHANGPTWTSKYGNLRKSAAKQRGDNTGLVDAASLHNLGSDEVEEDDELFNQDISEALAKSLDDGCNSADLTKAKQQSLLDLGQQKQPPLQQPPPPPQQKQPVLQQQLHQQMAPQYSMMAMGYGTGDSNMYNHNLHHQPGAFGVTPSASLSTPAAPAFGSAPTVAAPPVEGPTPGEITEVRDACTDLILETEDEEEAMVVQGVHDRLSRPYDPQFVATNKRMKDKNMSPAKRVAKLSRLQKVKEASEAKAKGK